MKLLVIEDDPFVAETLKSLLSSCAYAVDIAPDGEVGCQLLEAFEYDLVLLDVILPKVDGVTLCQQLRDRGLQMPVLLLTGQGGDATQKAIALNAGADDYVVKPFDANELLARVQALLRRGNLSSQPILTWGLLRVDPVSRTVTYGAQIVIVTPKEYGILELLLRSPDRALGARAIVDHVWDSIESPGEESVRVHIKEIRKKLAAAGAPSDLIKTIHRVGYRLNLAYSDFLAAQVAQAPTLPNVAELASVNHEMRAVLTQLQADYDDLRLRYADLEQAYLRGDRPSPAAAPPPENAPPLAPAAMPRPEVCPIPTAPTCWQMAFEQSWDAIALIDHTGQVLAVNTAACRLVGLSQSALLRHNLADLVPSGWAVDPGGQPFWQGLTLPNELPLRGPNGQVRHTALKALTHIIPGQHLLIFQELPPVSGRESRHRGPESPLRESA